jgi:hypothetical protein
VWHDLPARQEGLAGGSPTGRVDGRVPIARSGEGEGEAYRRAVGKRPQMTLTREVELAAMLGFGFDDVDMLLMAGFRRDAREGSMQVLRNNLWGRRHEGENFGLTAAFIF